MNNALTHHKNFTPEEFDAQYNLRARRTDFEHTVLPDWTSRSVAARESLQCQLDIRYAEGENQKFDLFTTNNHDAPVLVYFHGGYWQAGDKSIYSFLAQPYIEAGVNVVVVGYDLCPAVSITRITQEAREAMAYLWLHAEALQINRERISVMGHSAGGHITQMIMATEWTTIHPELPVNLVKSGIPISPISYLEPVRLTEALNAGIQMDAVEAHDQSPMTKHPPLTDAPQLLVVGGAETTEFHRQSWMYIEKYTTEKRSLHMYVVPDVDHFDELNILADANSELFNKTLKMLA